MTFRGTLAAAVVAIGFVNAAERARAQTTAGGFLDAGYLQSFESPSNHLCRSRGTTPRVDEFDVNMAAAYLRKDRTPSSRCGFELTVHTGEDSKVFGFSATVPSEQPSSSAASRTPEEPPT